MRTINTEINGDSYEDEVEARLLLVHYLRDRLGLTGTKIGCDTSNCGACTVYVDGYTAKSCSVLAVQADGAVVTTIEGIARGDGDAEGAKEVADTAGWHPVQRAFHTEHGLQCGYCTPGMVMATIDLLRETPDPTEDDIRRGLEGNLCRCTGYTNILKAVRAAAHDVRTYSPANAGTAQWPPADWSDRESRPRALPEKVHRGVFGRSARVLAGVVLVAVAVRLSWRVLRSGEPVRMCPNRYSGASRVECQHV